MNSKIIIKSTHVSKVSEDDIGMIFFIALENTDCEDYHIYVQKIKCIECIANGDNDADMVSIIGGYMGIMKGNSTKCISVVAPTL